MRGMPILITRPLSLGMPTGTSLVACIVPVFLCDWFPFCSLLSFFLSSAITARQTCRSLGASDEFRQQDSCSNLGSTEERRKLASFRCAQLLCKMRP